MAYLLRLIILVIYVLLTKSLIASNLSNGTFLNTILLYFSLAIIIEQYLKWFTKISHNNILLFIGSLTISLIGLEAYLQFGSNNYKVYTELNEGFYASPYTYNKSLNGQSINKVLFNEANLEKTTVKFEYQYSYSTNELGLIDAPNSMRPKKKGCQRILALGDSFTEGAGAPQDSSWVNLLELKLSKQHNIDIDVLNAGKSGNDPLYSYEMLNRLLEFKPDLVLLAINKTELGEINARGGFERFENGRLNLKKGPKWEFLYATSFVVRYYIQGILKQDYNFTLPFNNEKKIEAAYSILIESLNRHYALALKNNFAFMVILQPDIEELFNGQLALDEAYLREGTKNKINFINLIPCMTSKIKDKNKLPSDFYWPIDAHFNSAGYNIMAECLSEMLAPPSPN